MTEWVVYHMSNMVLLFQVCVREIFVIESLHFLFTNPSGSKFSVIWGHVSEEVAHAVKEDLIAIKDELRNNKIKRWQAIGSLKHVLSFVSLQWELKKHTINFLLCITDDGICRNCDDEHSEWSSYMPNIFSALQVLQFPSSFHLSFICQILYFFFIKKNADTFFTFGYTITFQAVKMVIMYAPDPEIRKNSFAVLKGVSF